jgi:hypothetical protein
MKVFMLSFQGLKTAPPPSEQGETHDRRNIDDLLDVHLCSCWAGDGFLCFCSDFGVDE